MRTLFVVTDSEATHHVEGVVGGWHDSQLTHAGVRAAVSIPTGLRRRHARVAVMVNTLTGTRPFASPALPDSACCG